MIRNPAQNRVSRPRSQKPITYAEDILGDIAAAIGKDLGDLLPYRSRFEAFAQWHEMDEASPERPPPSLTKRKLEQIGAAARKLLKHLGIDDPDEAPDGPSDITVLCALASVNGQTEDSIALATAQLGRLAEIVESI